MADIVGSNYNITDLHRFGGFIGDKALNSFFTGSQFGGWVIVENVPTLKQQQFLREFSNILWNVFACHIRLKSNMVAVGMGVEYGIHTIEDWVNVLGLVQGVVVPIVPLRQIMAEIN